MAKIDFPDKTEGSKFNHNEANSIKQIVNENDDMLSQAANDAALALATARAATPLLQPETASYQNRVKLKGFSISAIELNALDTFVSTGKTDGWYDDIVMFAPILGSNLISAMVKFKVESGGVDSLIPYNLIEPDYVKNIGISLPSNQNKYIDTGIVPLLLGLSKSNICFGFMQNEYIGSQSPGYLIGDNPDTNDGSIGASATGVIFVGNGVSGATATNAVGGKRAQLLSVENSSTSHAYLNGAYTVYRHHDTKVTGDLDTKITLFKSRRLGNDYYEIGSISYFIVARGIDGIKGLSLSKALYKLYQDIGRLPTRGGISAWFGDSITAGQGVSIPSDRFSAIVSAALSSVEYNVGVPSSQLRKSGTDTTGFVMGGFDRFLFISEVVNTMFILYGTNDMNFSDYTADGDPEEIADYRLKLEAIVINFKSKGMRVILITPPFNTSNSPTKISAYADAVAQVGASQGCTVADLYRAMVDTGTPESYLSDAVHLNSAGHKLASKTIINAVGRIATRNLSVDFPSIGPGAFYDIQIKIYGARENMSAYVGEQSSPVNGIIFKAFVSANDTVSLRAMNVTGSSIDMPAQRIQVQVNL